MCTCVQTTQAIVDLYVFALNVLHKTPPTYAVVSNAVFGEDFGMGNIFDYESIVSIFHTPHCTNCCNY